MIHERRNGPRSLRKTFITTSSPLFRSRSLERIFLIGDRPVVNLENQVIRSHRVLIGMLPGSTLMTTRRGRLQPAFSQAQE
jgi:hypothetical protein